MLAQLQSVRSKTQTSSALAQAPLHWGAEASPHEVVRHSHAPLSSAARQRPLPPQPPRHWPSSKRHWPLPSGSVVVVLEPGGGAFRFAGAQRKREARNVITRWPNWSIALPVDAGFAHFAR
jgi:hypothetical protein